MSEIKDMLLKTYLKKGARPESKKAEANASCRKASKAYTCRDSPQPWGFDYGHGRTENLQSEYASRSEVSKQGDG